MVATAVAGWLTEASTTWIPVVEARPEVTRRRDTGTSAAWLTGKRVLILGCGALGAPAAEICVRAGAAEATVADNGVVHPGILVRQPYEDARAPSAGAVAASAALPLLLPAIERFYTFTRDGSAVSHRQAVLLSDGGIYDNLGLTVLEPGRSASHTAHVYDIDYVIACDAGRGRLPLVAGHFAGSRLRRSFDTVHRRAQDAARGKLHDAAAGGHLKGFERS